MEVKIILLAIFVILSVNCVNAKRILITHPSPSQSHVIPVQILAKLLAERGHDVTLISSFPVNKDGKIKNFRDIKIDYDDKDKSETMKEMLKNPGATFSMTAMQQMPQIIATSGNSSLQSQEVRKMMKDESFDLVIVGYFFSEFLLGLGDHFKCPTVVISSFGMFSPLAWMVGNPMGIPAASHIALPMKGTSFFERLATFLMYILEAPITKILFDSLSRNVYK
jgi:glucuronosyltransferase